MLCCGLAASIDDAPQLLAFHKAVGLSYVPVCVPLCLYLAAGLYVCVPRLAATCAHSPSLLLILGWLWWSEGMKCIADSGVVRWWLLNVVAGADCRCLHDSGCHAPFCSRIGLG